MRFDEPRSYLTKGRRVGHVQIARWNPRCGTATLLVDCGMLRRGAEILERIFNVMFYDRRVMMSKGFVLLLNSSADRCMCGHMSK